MRRIIRLLSVLLVILAGGLGAPGLAAAQPPGAQAFDVTGCTPVNAAGYQLCASGKGTVQRIVPPGGTPFFRLSLTSVPDLKRNGTLLQRGEEQHLEMDLTQKSAGSQGAFSRAGSVVVAGDVTCTYNDSSALANNGVTRDLSNLACTSGTAARAAPKAAPLPTYSDYSAVNSAPNGLATPIRYGTVGQGNPKTDDCTVTTTTNPQTAVNNAAAGAIICVKPGNYSTSTLTVNKAVTVRANGVVSLKNIVISGSNAVVDGFTVVGGTLGNPNYAVKFSGTGHKIVNNLVRGRGIWYAIGCEQSAGCGSNVLIAGNTITGVHNFGIYLWGGDHITVEKNNVFDLFQSQDVDDVDALRAWGNNHVVRNNYFHDINAKKSAGAPHSDCYQSYQAGSTPAPVEQHSVREQLLRPGHRPVHHRPERPAQCRRAARLRHSWQRLRDLRLAEHRDDRHPEHHHGQRLRRRGPDNGAQFRQRRGRRQGVDQLQGPQQRSRSGDQRFAVHRRHACGQHGQPHIRRSGHQDVV